MSRAGPGGKGGPGLPGPGAGGAPGDPGLARARTSLAWTRTALSFAAIGGVILKRELAAGFVVLGLSCLVWLVGRWLSYRACRARCGPAQAPCWRSASR